MYLQTKLTQKMDLPSSQVFGKRLAVFLAMICINMLLFSVAPPEVSLRQAPLLYVCLVALETRGLERSYSLQAAATGPALIVVLLGIQVHFKNEMHFILTKQTES